MTSKAPHFDQPSPYRVSRYAEHFRDFAGGHPALVKLQYLYFHFWPINRKNSPRAYMERRVSSAASEFKIGRAIVKFIPILVMNKLARIEFPPQFLLHDPPVLQNPAIVAVRNNPVPLRSDTARTIQSAAKWFKWVSVSLLSHVVTITESTAYQRVWATLYGTAPVWRFHHA